MPSLQGMIEDKEKELEDLLVLTEKEKGDWTEETLGSAGPVAPGRAYVFGITDL